MFRPDRRWIRNCGRSLIPEAVWGTERQHPAYSPPQLGVDTAAGSMPGMAVAASWFAHPAVPPECPGSLSSHRAHFREPPLGLRETLGASHITCIVLCPLTILTQRIGPPLPSIPSAVTSGVVQDGCPFFASIQLLPLDPWSMLTLKIPFQQPLTHSYPFRLFLTSLSLTYTGDIQTP